DPLKTSNSRADQHPRTIAFTLAFRLPAGIEKRLVGRRNRKDNKVVDLTLLFRLHPVIGIEVALACAPRYETADLAGDVGYVKFGDAPSTTLAGYKSGPGGSYSAPYGRNQPYARNNHTPHATPRPPSPSLKDRRLACKARRRPSTGGAQCPNFRAK